MEIRGILQEETSIFYELMGEVEYDVIAFYGKNGFIPVGILPDVYGPKNEGMLYMRKVIRR